MILLVRDSFVTQYQYKMAPRTMNSGEKQENDSNRRDFLSGELLKQHLRQRGEAIADQLQNFVAEESPRLKNVLMLSTSAMACEFSILFPHHYRNQLDILSDELDQVHPLESQMTVYRQESDLIMINQNACHQPVRVESRLYDLLKTCRRISQETAGAFDPTAGSLVELWRNCKTQGRIPTQQEIDICLARTGMDDVHFDHDQQTVSFMKAGLTLNLGGIGKGYALDRIGENLKARGVSHWLMHGGRSSVLASGLHDEANGWPIELNNPLFPGERFMTILLKDAAMATSGSGTQFYRHLGKRYGHIIDPRTGWPAKDMMSVSVIAPSSAEADALSTAFFVLGMEKTLEMCDNRNDLGVILFPNQNRGRSVTPIIQGISADSLFFW